LFTFVRDLLIEYNSVENALIDYLLIDYAIELAIEKLGVQDYGRLVKEIMWAFIEWSSWILIISEDQV